MSIGGEYPVGVGGVCANGNLKKEVVLLLPALRKYLLPEGPANEKRRTHHAWSRGFHELVLLFIAVRRLCKIVLVFFSIQVLPRDDGDDDDEAFLFYFLLLFLLCYLIGGWRPGGRLHYFHLLLVLIDLDSIRVCFSILLSHLFHLLSAMLSLLIFTACFFYGHDIWFEEKSEYT